MILNNKTQDWEKEAQEFSSFFGKVRGLMFKREIDNPAVFPLDREKVSIWNFMVFAPFVVVGLNKSKRVKEKVVFPAFPKLKLNWFEECEYLVEDSIERKGKYKEGDLFEIRDEEDRS